MPLLLPAFRAQRTSSHDGDTTTFLMDNWFTSRAEEPIRFAGVRAPEIEPPEPGSEETLAYVDGWFEGVEARNKGLRYPLRWPYRILTDKLSGPEPNQRMSFTRYIGWIYDATTGRCLNDDVNAFLAVHPDWPSGKLVRP